MPQDGGLSSVSNAAFVETHSRDLLGHVTNIVYRTHSGYSLASFAYRRDAAGLVTQKVSRVGTASPPATNSYAYDALGRLTSADNESYTYDLAGNRLSRTGVPPVTYTHNRPDGVLHDAAGNVTSYVRDGIAHSLSWNTQGQLLSVTTNGAFAESYTYDSLDRRVSTTDSSGTTYHVYDGDHCAADVDASGNPLRLYTWGPGIDNLLAVTVFGTDATNTYYAVKDHLGSVHALIDSSGELPASYAYYAWGNVLSSYSLLPAPYSLRVLWQGREYSHATGLYNFRARWYVPAYGRWLSPDPIGLEGGLNLYEFCGNNPVNYRDPNGLWTVQIGGSVTAGAAFGGTIGGGLVFGGSGISISQFGAYGIWGGGSYIGVGASGTIDVTFSRNENICALDGMALTSGGSFPFLTPITPIGVDVNIPLASPTSPQTYSVTGNGGIGIGTPEVHFFLTETGVIQWK